MSEKKVLIQQYLIEIDGDRCGAKCPHGDNFKDGSGWWCNFYDRSMHRKKKRLCIDENLEDWPLVDGVSKEVSHD